MPEIGDQLDKYWPIEDMFYAGKVSKFDEDNKYHINRFERDQEQLNLSEEVWKSSQVDSISTSNAQVSNRELLSTDQDTLKNSVKALCQKTFQEISCPGTTFVSHDQYI